MYLPPQTANVNNCDTLAELTTQLKTKYAEDGAPPDRLYGARDRDKYHAISNQFIQVAEQG